ncbi:YdcF family protein [Rossellomorea sp. SC111]|uniref:YdcF family protein n=1 Tax=Rossellomorea sp. SC111 TaxID=2968985 RepID=UPI00215A4133|nr:YdcF family protein [Rossellomorea sp. SC111]MCR8847945.1 YdcF family protein [Rossellomorea sp. SC111]
MHISKLNHEHLTNDQMTHLLFSSIHDDQMNGDCIFVAGSSKAVKYRLPKAVELYKQGRADKILFSGGVKWPGAEFPEAQQLKKEAISLGVSEEDILTEDVSLHTLENVLASLLVLNRAFHLYNIRRVLVVTSSYHMRRMHLTLKTYMPDWISFTLCPVDDDNTNEDNWFLSETGVKRVKGETEKLIRYVKQGALEDEDILLIK